MSREKVTLRILRHEDIAITMDSGVSLFFGLRGRYTIATANEEYAIGASEIYAISPFTLYRVYGSGDAGLIQINLSAEILKLAKWPERQMIACYLTRRGLTESLALEVRQRCASVFRIYFQHNNEAELVRQATALAVLLRDRFAVSGSSRPEESINTLKLLEHALKLIHTRWNLSLSLTEVAAELYVSESYISRLFKKYLGTTFTKYLVGLRLEHAVSDLQSGQPVTEVAYRNGFKSDNSFIDFFKKAYGCTPGKYRQMHRASAEKQAPPEEDISDWLQELLQYDNGAASNVTDESKTVERKIRLNIGKKTEPIVPTWRRLVNIGYARDGLIGAVQEQLRRAQKEIGFTYIRFHGILNDDMHIYQEKADGSPWYNFTYADLLFDFILQTGLIPYVELSFMPAKLAKTQYTPFDNAAIRISMYNDAEKWEALIQACISHWIDKYGLANVRKWKFTILSYNYAKVSDQKISHEEYCEMFAATYTALKTIDPELSLGGGGCFPSIALEKDGLGQFLTDMKACGCLPDFISLQCYPHEKIVQDSDFVYFTSNQMSIPSILSKDGDFMLHFLQHFNRIKEKLGLSACPVIIEEWNSTLWQRDLSSDSCYKAAWLVKNALQNCNQVEGIGYWLLTDFIEEWMASREVFHGGYGLFTINGIPKAGYQALRLLNRVGERKVDAWEGWFVSRTEDAIQIYLYHYCHYDALYRYRYQKLRDPHDAYKVFQTQGKLKMELEICGLSSGIYRQESWILGRNAGSSFDKWLEMGAPGVMTLEDIQYLRDASQPICRICDRDTTGVLKVQAVLEPHEVQVIILQKRDG